MAVTICFRQKKTLEENNCSEHIAQQLRAPLSHTTAFFTVLPQTQKLDLAFWCWTAESWTV